MKQDVGAVATLTDLLDENDELSNAVDDLNKALETLNGSGNTSLVSGSTIIELDQFDEDTVRRFIVAIKNEAIEVQEEYTAKIKQLTGLLNE